MFLFADATASPVKKSAIKKISMHLNVCEKRKKQRTQTTATYEYTKRVETVPFDDGWLGFEEPVLHS